MENEEPNKEISQQKSNLIGLRIVLVLSIVGGGITCLTDLFLGLCMPKIAEIYQNGSLTQLPEMYKVAFENSLDIPQLCYLLNGVLSALSVAGAAMMWGLKREGFHFYTVAQLLMIVVSILFLGKANMQLGDLMMTALFIAFYFFTLKSLGIFNIKEKTEES